MTLDELIKKLTYLRDCCDGTLSVVKTNSASGHKIVDVKIDSSTGGFRTVALISSPY